MKHPQARINRKVCFIAGTGHSGSTLLGFLLGNHSTSFFCGEGKKSLYLNQENFPAYKRFCKFCGPDCSIWGQLSLNAEQDLYEQLAQRILHKQDQQKTLMIDSSSGIPWIRQQWQLLQNTTAQRYLIFLQRDGRGVVNSYRRKYPERDFAEIIKKWLDNIQKSQALFDEFTGPKMVLRYEEIAKLAIAQTRAAVPQNSTPAEIDDYIVHLPEIAEQAIAALDFPPQPELSPAEIDQQTNKIWSWQLVQVGGGTIEPPAEPRSPYKVFGLGLSRTGTKSLTSALHILGFKVIHYPEDETTLRELTEGHYQFSLLDHFDGITDITVSPFYPQLDQLFPGSKFILTVRDKESWLTSLEKHWFNRPAVDQSNQIEKEIHKKYSGKRETQRL